MEDSKLAATAKSAARRHGAPAPGWMQREAAKLIRTHGLQKAAKVAGIGDDALMRIATGAHVTPTTIALAKIHLENTANGSSA